MNQKHKVWLWGIFTITCLLLASYAHLTAKEAETQAVTATKAILAHYLEIDCGNSSYPVKITAFNLTATNVTWQIDCGSAGNKTRTTPIQRNE